MHNYSAEVYELAFVGCKRKASLELLFQSLLSFCSGLHNLRLTDEYPKILIMHFPTIAETLPGHYYQRQIFLIPYISIISFAVSPQATLSGTFPSSHFLMLYPAALMEHEHIPILSSVCGNLGSALHLTPVISSFYQHSGLCDFWASYTSFS